MLRFWWSRLRRRCGDGAAAIDEAIVGAAPWRWRTGWLNRLDGEMDDESSSGEVDEGRRAVAVDDVVGEEAPAGCLPHETGTLRVDHRDGRISFRAGCT